MTQCQAAVGAGPPDRAPVAPGGFSSQRLERVFNQCFSAHWRTRLAGGASEPYYQPAAGAGDFHLLYYRSDYFASALHETAHWCIAGDRRRQLADFGYWYAPDGRSPEQQRDFEAVEARPQALEWLFSLACGYRFHVSADNLGAPDDVSGGNLAFKQQVLVQALAWQEHDLPRRAQRFFDALALDFGSGLRVRELALDLSGLAA